MRELPVAAGQNLQATVVAVSGTDVWLGWRGAVFAARTDLALEPGRAYEFTVAATAPRIVLSRALPVPAPAVPAADLAMGGAGLGGALAALAEALGAAGASPGADGRGPRAAPSWPFGEAVARWLAGPPAAADLAAIQRGLGHDLEARVLRLATAPPADGEGAALRETAKARALLLLAEPRDGPAPPPEAARSAARALVEGLNGVERENARRSELGAPLWLPLPAAPAAGLRDARMFLLRGGAEEARGGTGGAERPFTIVLLLELSRLGEVRVDLVLRGRGVQATVQAVSPAAVELLARSLGELRSALEEGGLSVDGLSVRRTPEPVLPIADLVLPRDGTALVDVHA